MELMKKKTGVVPEAIRSATLLLERYLNATPEISNNVRQRHLPDL
jgi:hypothetical protein